MTGDAAGRDQAGSRGQVATSAAPALQVSDLCKAFPGTLALDRVGLEVAPGTVHALLGGNGSGKSTTVKVLAGAYRADQGQIRIADREWDARHFTAAAARAAGLAFVHQDLALFEGLSIAENFALDLGFPHRGWRRGRLLPRGLLPRGLLPSAAGAIAWPALHARSRSLLDRYEIEASPRTLVRDLRPADRAMVAIARALGDSDRTSVLVLDEPTASLPEHESRILLDAIRRRAEAGQTVLLVSHRLQEVLAVADRLTVLRDGRDVGSLACRDASESQIITMIAGTALPPQAARGGRPPGRAMLSVRDLSAGILSGVDLDVAAGEIVGVAGLLGSGRSALLRAVFGALPRAAGSIAIDGQPLLANGPAGAMAAGVAYVPEDRLGEAAFTELSLRDNVCAAVISRYFRRWRIRRSAERADTADLMRRFSIRAASPDAPFRSLSGGNQQKAVLARWLRRDPRVLLLDEPTQGVDAVARQEVYRLVRQAADQGAGILVASSDFEELALLCDRALVLRQGRVTAEVAGHDLGEARLTALVQSAADGDQRA